MKKNIIFIAFSVFFLSTTSFAFDVEEVSENKEYKDQTTDLKDKVDSLERKIFEINQQVLSSKSYRGASSNIIQDPTIESQLDDVYQQIKIIRGNIEQLQFDTARLNDQFVKFTADVEYRLNEIAKSKDAKSEIEKKLKSIDEQLDKSSNKGKDEKAHGGKPSKKPPRVEDMKIPKDPEELYQKAFSLLKDKEYALSQKLFQKFIDDNQHHALISSAYFWLGEVLFQYGSYDQAAVSYLKGYQKDSKGKQAPSNLLKLSEALNKLNKRKEACITLTKLKAEFPDAQAAIKKKAEENFKDFLCR